MVALSRPINKTKMLEYVAELNWDNQSGGEINIRNFPPIKLDTPVEFGGKGKYPCPGELFVSAIGGCLLTTLLLFQRKWDLRPDAIQISVNGTVDYLGPEGYRLSGIEATINIKAAEEKKMGLKKCAELAREYCHVTHVLEEVIPVRILIKIL